MKIPLDDGKIATRWGLEWEWRVVSHHGKYFLDR